jgi:response regulator NasT
MTDPVIHDISPSGADKHSLSILLVDDEAPVVEMMSVMLQSFGHKVSATANNGLDAIRLAAEKKPDLIILDVGMPGMDGITVAEKILAVQSVPIIIVTGVTRDEAVDRASQLEIQSYLIKPFSKEQFQSAIRLAVVRHHNAQSAVKKIEELTSEIEMSKIINRAVELLIGKFGIDRSEAMEKLEAAAQARSCSVADAAKAISATLGR